MPYIKNEDRVHFRAAVNEVYNQPPRTAGELNYLITKMCEEYLNFNGKNYGRMNDVVGALDCAKMEFYRRVVSPYEDEKINENGDVYGVD